MKTNKKYLEECLTRIQYLQELQQNVMVATNYLHSACHDNLNTGNILDKLYDAELKEFRTLFIFALTVDDETKDRIKLIAHERFLKAKCDISYLFNDGMVNQAYSCQTEEEFREMARIAFAPKELKYEPHSRD